MKRITPDEWRIYAEAPGMETLEIKGLKDKADADDWLSGTRKIDWLRAQGHAK